MIANANPFTPSFGTPPPVLAGRDAILADWETALDSGPRHPDYTLLFLGMRGAGKTAMLNAVEDLARQRRWQTISEDAASRGVLSRIEGAAARILADLDSNKITDRISGLSVAGVGVSLEQPAPERSPDLRSLLTRLGRILEESRAGLLITIDELQGADLEDMRRFGSIIQHVTRREGHPIAFVGAGLPQIEDSILSDDEATFLQRCSRRSIGPLDDRATSTAIAAPIQARNAAISPDALRLAVRAVSGYAFMTQLVGFHMWKAASDPHRGITLGEAEAGIAEAERQMGRLVLAPIWKKLSDVDRRFLLAMAEDTDESRLADVASRLAVNIGYAGVYRSRLIKSGMITSIRKGRIAFAHHATRQWLRQMDPLLKGA